MRAEMPPEVSHRMLITSQTGLWEQKWRFGIVWEHSGLVEETSRNFSARLPWKFTFKPHLRDLAAFCAVLEGFVLPNQSHSAHFYLVGFVQHLNHRGWYPWGLTRLPWLLGGMRGGRVFNSWNFF